VTGRSSPVDETRSTGEAEQVARRLEALLERVATGVCEVDDEGRFTYANAAALEMFQTTTDLLLGRTLSGLGLAVFDESGATVSAEGSPFLPTRGGGAARTGAIRCVRPPSLDSWLEFRVAASESQSGTVVSLTDITERRRTELANSESTARMSEALESMVAGVVVVDADGRIVFANPAAAAMSGLTPKDVVGQLVADPAWQLTDETGAVLPFESLPVPTALRERRAVCGVELGLPTLAGTTSWMRVSAEPLIEADGELRGAVVTTEDVTERHMLAEQLLQAQKLEGIGLLAGGIAHDFNNLLTVILGNAEVALARTPAGPESAGITEILEAANRGAALTRHMLTFARKQIVQTRALDLERLAASFEDLLQRALGETITLTFTSDPGLWPVKADPSQMEQLLLNMAINARDAMPNGGTVAIETRNAEIDAQKALAYPDVKPGDFVRLSVTDNGTGVSPEIVSRIFEPFFTTKPVGSGTGIGLSTCHGVVKQARGFITVDTELGRGTSFHAYLPRCAAKLIPEAEAVAPQSAAGKQTILLAEDQEPVRLLVARILEGYGYEVIIARDGQDALSAYAKLGAAPDLLLTDVVMPRMGGQQLARTLREREPELPVLYMTGFHDAGAKGGAAQEELLLKPFTPMQLLARVQDVLSRSASAGPPLL